MSPNRADLRFALAAIALAWLMLDGQLHVPVWVLLWGTPFVVLLIWMQDDLRMVYVPAWNWLRICACAAVLSAVRLVPEWLQHGSYVAGLGPPAPSLEVLTVMLLRPGQNDEMKTVLNWNQHEYSCYIGLAGLALLLGGIWMAARGVMLNASSNLSNTWKRLSRPPTSDLAGAAHRTNAVPWLVMTLATIAVMMSSTVFTWLRQFPLWQTERAPSRYVIVALFFALPAAALGWQTMWRGAVWQYLLCAMLLLGLTWDYARNLTAWIPQ